MAAYFQVTDDVVADIQRFRGMHGHRWKAALRDLWAKSGDLNAPWLRDGFSPLRWVRDVVGPGQLDQFERQLIAEGKLQPWESPPAATAQAEKLLLQVPEVSRLTGIPKSTLYPLLASGEIPSLKVGRRRFVRLESLKRWIEQQEAAQGGGLR